MTRRRIRPQQWTPPAARRGRATPVMNLQVTRINGTGPEDVLVDEHARILTGVEDGRILRIDADGRRIDTLADTGGRPLGLEWLPDATLLVCDAHRGLLRVDLTDGSVTTWIAAGGSSRLNVCNNAAVAADGTVYLSDSSQRFPLSRWRADLMEHSGTGRLLRRDVDGTVEVVAEGLHFANGVALAADESFVVVAETGAYRLTRWWLSGARAGEREVFLDGLAGFPDNIATGPSGLIWVAQASPRNRLLDVAHARAPWLLTPLAAAPQRVQPQPGSVVWVLAVDAAGRVAREFRTVHDGFDMVTGVREHEGRLVLGSLTGHGVAAFDL